MRVILLQSTKNIGQKGEVKDVSEGYFRNFLLPRNLAIPANDKQIAHLQAQKEKSVEKLESIKESAISIKSKIHGKTVTIKEKASETATLYRAITEKIIATAIEADLHVTIPLDCIKVKENIKTTGEWNIEINLYKDVQANITLKVESN